MLSNGKKQQQCKCGRHRGHHKNQLDQHLFLLFSGNLAVILDFLTLQDKHNIIYTYTLSENIKLFCTHCKTGLLLYLFLKLVQIKFIYTDNVHILSIYKNRKGIINVSALMTL